ncbi:MAG: geranylgeranylglycerol-phosphate geranylgeranyltransferase [Ferruginibacter sp.]
MKQMAGFFQIIRWQNLVFIALTQFVYFFALIGERSMPELVTVSSLWMGCLIVASVCIAAGGYAINDYFDVWIDHVNKPDRVVVDNVIRRRTVMLLHLLLSTTGLSLSFLVSYQTGIWSIGLGNLAVVFLLWLYSTTFKKQLLIGNLIISFMTAWVLIVGYLLVGGRFIYSGDLWSAETAGLLKKTMLYAGFAFSTTLIREVVKDLEDVAGDSKFGCKTMPIVWGFPVSKMFVAIWIFISAAMLLMLQLLAWNDGWRWSVFYSVVFLITPMLFLLVDVKKANTPSDFARLSLRMKWIMLAGILSMLLVA